MGADEPSIRQNAIAGRDAYIAGRDIVVGSGNVQVNVYGRQTTHGPLVVGNIPQEPPAFQPRADLLAPLRSAGPAVSVVRAVTGMRGVGKTQLAAAYARERIAAGWPVVAWTNAEEMPEVLSCLAEVAGRLGIAEPTDGAEIAGQRLRHWLEAGGERCLLVFDNVGALDLLLPYIPAEGRSQVVMTGTSKLLSVAGHQVGVEVFTEDEALSFLTERTGLDDPAGARELAAELGFLPLGLAQAAAAIAAQHLTFGTYLERLRSVPLGDDLRTAPGEGYPRRLAEAILLSMTEVAASDSTGLTGELLDLVAVLSPQGVSRDLLHRAGRAGALARTRSAGIDQAVARLAAASLLSLSTGDEMVMHPLVARVARERRADAGTLTAVAASACTLLEDVTGRITEPAQQEAETLDAVAHITALTLHVEMLLPDDQVALRLFALRDWALRGLLELRDGAAQAVTVGQSLAADSALLLGDDHPDTLARQGDLALAYLLAGRFGEAVPLLERVLAGRERVLGDDHPDTLTSLGNLALAYQDAGRAADAVPLFERVASIQERVLGSEHPDTLASLGNLALAYRGAGRPAEAVPLLERVVSGRERVLGPEHPDTLTSLGNLALGYQGAGRPVEAVPLLERVVSGRERVLGPDHPDTLAAGSNLALGYQRTGRLDEAISLFEQALVGLERVLGTDAPLTDAVRQNLADARRAVRGQPRVFISYEHDPRQAEIADKLAGALRSEELEVINVRDEIALGDVWASRLKDLVGSADVTLVLVPERGIESEWVRQEAEVALRRAQAGESVVIPVFLGGKAPPGRLPYGLAERQGITLNPEATRGFRSYASVARQVADAAAAVRRPARQALTPRGAPAGQLAAAELLDLSELVIAAFGAAGRQLRASRQPQLLKPGPVWISAERVPSARELDRFSGQLSADSVGYFVHVDELPPDTGKALDRMRVGGKRVVTVSERGLRAALADGRARVFLSELEQLYSGRDNQFDTRNALIDDRFFFGRDAILTTIGSMIKRDEHVLISGLRKVGKTSLLNILRLQLADRPVCTVDLELFDRNGEEWPLELFGLIVKAVDRWGRIGRKEWPFEFTPPTTGTDLARQLEERFSYAEGDPAGQRVVIMLDEIERAFPRRGEVQATRRWIRAAGALRALAQGGRRYVVVIGADLRPTANRENNLGNGETNPFFSFFQEVPVSLLDRESTGVMLRTIARASGVDTVSTDFTDTLFGRTGGHPSLARWIAAEAYRKKRDPERMDLADLEAGLASLEDTDSVGSFIRTNLWEPMTPAEKEVTTDLSRSRLGRWLRHGGGPAHSAARASLRSHGIIDGRTIRIGLLQQWVRDNVGA